MLTFNTGLIILLVIVGAAAYANSFSGPFIFDDEGGILDNPYIIHLWPLSKAMSAAPQSPVAGRPAASLSLAINYAISKYAVWSYHIFNLLIHILAALTLYGIIRRTLLCSRLNENFGNHAEVLAWAAAAIWMVHPIQTESVTYIIQRTELMMGLFYLLTLYLAIRTMCSQRPFIWSVLSVICCGLGMATKEVMVTAPFLVLLYDRTFAAGSFRQAFIKRSRFYIALAATWGILILLMRQGPRSMTIGFSIGTAALDYAMNQSIVIMHYLRLAFWPKGLCLYYNLHIIKDWSKILPPLLAVLFMTAVTLWGLFRNRNWAYLSVWFFGILAPTSSFIPIADLAFEHRMYLPLAGLTVLAVTAGYTLLNQAAKQSLFISKFGHRIGLILLTIIIITLSLTTLRRNNDYRSAMAIWQSVLEVVPDNPVAHNNFGLALKSLGRVNEAIKHYQTAIEIDPGEARAYNNLGIALKSQGKLDEALNYYRRAILINPNYADAHNNLGNALRQQGKFDEAVSHFKQALQLDPENANIYFNLGLTLQSQNKLNEALDCFNNAHRLRPDWAPPAEMAERLRKQLENYKANPKTQNPELKNEQKTH
jgi:tetratricopeptide (TPR) repeat protein